MSSVPKRWLPLASILCWLSIVSPLRAEHITGGQIGYEQLDPLTYLFTLDVYHDCFADPPVVGLPGALYLDAGLYTSTVLDAVSYEEVFSPRDSCMSPIITSCVKRARYQWLVVLPADHHLQRKTIVVETCCRDDAINNIWGPDARGPVYVTEIYPAPAGTISQGPQPRSLGARFICANDSLVLDLGSADSDGDSIAYAYHHPQKSRNLFTGFDPPPIGPPVPPPPPYEEVVYKMPYAFDDPFGYAEQTLDTLSGLLAGSYSLTGEFLVGLRVDEYRNGVLLSTQYRTLQINVIACPGYQTIALAAPLVDGVYRYSGCGELAVTFANLGIKPEWKKYYRWHFSTGDTIPRRWEPTVSFPGYGRYTGEFILYPGEVCADTARLDIRIGPPAPVASYSVDYDSCTVAPVRFLNNSSGTGPLTYAWALGDGQTSDHPAPAVLYDTAAVLGTRLIVTDTSGCADTARLAFDYFPATTPSLGLAGGGVGCPPYPITFGQTLTNVDPSYTVTWTFGTGDEQTAIAPTYTYTEVGSYDVGLRIESPNGCAADTLFSELVEIRSPVAAAFAYAPEVPTTLEPTVTLTAAPAGIDYFTWQVDGAPYAYGPDTELTLTDTSGSTVMLLTRDTIGCRDSLSRILGLAPAATYFLPNAFTPDADGRNDVFIGTGVTDYLEDFELRVFDRYGEQVFVSEAADRGWTGEHRGRAAPAGVYVWTLRYRIDGRAVAERGSVLLLR